MSSEPVGSLAEEAAKLIAAVQGWAADQAGERSSSDDAAHTAHTAHTGHTGQTDDAGRVPAECRWCPLCQLVRAAKATSPEVREHLTAAALSLALAFKGLMEAGDGPAQQTDPSERSDPVEKIDLDSYTGRDTGPDSGSDVDADADADADADRRSDATALED
jgi:hypothetical protein